MSKPLGSILGGTFFFFQNGVLTNPAPLPTVTVCALPDGNTVVPPALTNPAPGIFYAAQLFSAIDTATLEGVYSAFAETSDAAVDNPQYLVEWEVEAVSGDVAVVLAAIEDIQSRLPAALINGNMAAVCLTDDTCGDDSGTPIIVSGGGGAPFL